MVGLSIHSAFSLDEELRLAVELLRRGSVEQRVPPGQGYPSSTRRYLILLYLSGGFERLLKCALINLRKEAGQPVTMQELRRGYGHDLVQVLDDLLPLAAPVVVNQPPKLVWSRDYLAADPLWRERLPVLATFAKHERFHELDRVTGHEHDDSSPQQRWARLEMDVGIRHFGGLDAVLALTGTGDGAAYYGPALAQHAEVFERAAFALACIFQLGPVGESARRMSFDALKPLRQLAPR